MRTTFLLCLLAVPLLAQPVRTFDTPEAAAEALIQAVQHDDTAALDALFGPGAKSLLTSGDPQRDTQERAEFSRLAQSKHHLEADPMNKNRMYLDVGSEDWPFPAPIVKTNGKWAFDASRAARELKARRLGANELDVIEVCAGFVQAEKQYAAQDRDRDGLLEYASHLMSSPGKSDGLFVASDSRPLVPKAFAEAEVDGHSQTDSKPYHGYYFRILRAQGPNAPGGAHDYVVNNSKERALVGGFALLAWPAQYGVTGIHTFMVGPDGMTYEKDLQNPQSVQSYDPDRSWKRVE